MTLHILVPPTNIDTDSFGPNISGFFSITANTTVGLASITNNGVMETIIIPFHTAPGQPGTDQTITDGQIVATRLIPEPSTIVLAAVGALALLAHRWRLA